MEHRAPVDMLRFYGGDIRERTKDGKVVFGESSKDTLWGDNEAYRTLNALLFDGYENEKERIFKEKKKLNPAFIERLDETLAIYTGVFSMMCLQKEKNISTIKVKRVDRQASLNAYQKGFTGSFVACTKGASVIMNNKHWCKQVLKDNNLQSSKSCLVNSLIPLNIKEISSWNFPLFVKPNCEGSSLGISSDSVCHTIEEVQCKVNELIKSFNEVLVEEFITGVDITNYLIGNPGKYYINDVITAELYDKSPYAIYDITAKHNKLRTLFFNEEKIPSDILLTIRTQSEKIAETVGARDICRIDYRLDMQTYKFTFIEINSAPRFSSTSEIGFIAQKYGITFKDMVQYYLKAFNDRIY